MDRANVWAELTKSEKQPDGSILVYGKVSDETLDIDQQIADHTWLKAALPAWMKFGNIREQHSAIAAGVATELSEKDGGHYITAKIVDAGSISKVLAGVLKGFSIGVKSPQVVLDKAARGGRIVGGQVVEVSLVDRPANPSCMLALAKAAGGGSLVRVETLVEVGESTADKAYRLDQAARLMESSKQIDDPGISRAYVEKAMILKADKMPDGSRRVTRVCCAQCPGDSCTGGCCKACTITTSPANAAKAAELYRTGMAIENPALQRAYLDKAAALRPRSG